MNDIVAGIVSNAGQAPEMIKLDNALGAYDLEERRTENDHVIKGSPRSTIIDDPAHKQEEMKNIPQEPDTVTEAVADLINAIDPENRKLFKHPRYYAQTGGRRGFQYGVRLPNGRDEVIIFEHGVYITHDRAIAAQLEADINRQGGIGAHVQNITKQNYENIVSQASRFKTMTGGMAGSDMFNPHKKQREDHIKSLEATVAEQKRQIEKLMKEGAELDEMPQATAPAATETFAERIQRQKAEVAQATGTPEELQDTSQKAASGLAALMQSTE